MIFVFYSNDPLGDDQGGGAEHFRCIHRALRNTDTPYKLISARLQGSTTTDKNVEYISTSSNFGKYFFSLWIWFFKNRANFKKDDVFHFHRNYAAWPKYIFSKKKGAVIITYHNTTGEVIKAKLGFASKPIRKIMKYFERRALDSANKIIFVSDRDRQRMRKDVIRDNYNKTIVIPAAFNSSIFTNNTPLQPDLAYEIVVIGRLAYQKNIPLAIETFNHIKNRENRYRLTIAGGGEDKDEIISMIENSPYKDSINYIGMIDHEQVPELISRHGIVFVTSRYEASPTIVKETIASERVIVTTDVGDVGIWVDNDTYGFICDHNIQSLEQGLIKATNLIANNRYQRTIDLERFSEKSIMNELLNEYQ